MHFTTKDTETPYQSLCNLADYAYVYKNEYSFKSTNQSDFEDLHERISEEADKRIRDDFVWHDALVSFDFPFITVKPL